MVEHIARLLAHYSAIGDALYKRGVACVFMKCIDSGAGKRLLEKSTPGNVGYTQHRVHSLGRHLGLVFTGQMPRKM
jgi:hypothetical protein